MSLFDIGLLVILLVFIWKGFRSGLVGAIGGLFGILLSIWAGSHYMEQIGGWLMTVLGFDNMALANIAGFILIFVAVNIAVGIIVSVVNRVFHIIPFINLINKLMGSIVGLVGGILAVSALVYLMSLFPISEAINEMLIESQIANWAESMSVIIRPFIPEAIRELRSIL
ncbi:CvpA family protein [Candidatus Parcubacteria bacterium]|jgi:uncharacterized membrane protein required for colicin V production|nr:CvpA family protein [Candidatus Parcubacteria bacterium]MBT7228497.1 CvpA family protein [Candidatus Parcubacteria bacterium]